MVGGLPVGEINCASSVNSKDTSAAPLAECADQGVSSHTVDVSEDTTTCEPSLDVGRAIQELERRLLETFERKLLYDAFKEKQIDRLHEELQGYKSDLLDKALRPLFSRMIKLHGDISRLIEGVRSEDPQKVTVDKVLSLFGSFREEVEDLLTDHGVHPYTGDVGAKFDPRRQSSVGTVESANPELISTVALTVRPGFEQGSSVLEKERVRVYAALKQSAPSLPVGE